MRRIIYRSLAAPELDRAELFRLLYHARIANEAQGLTGVLLQADRDLLQVIEGPTLKLNATFAAICRDPRHRDIAVIDEAGIAQVTFPRWPMRYFHDHDIVKAVKAMTAEAGDAFPEAIAAAISDLFVESFVAHTQPSPSLPEAALPSCPRPC